MSAEFWFMFPVAVVIASVAMASGVEGTTFFAPLFILVLDLSPEVAIGTGLITAVFGFGSGLVAYVKKKLIDVRLGLMLSMVTVPMAAVGSWLGGWLDPDPLRAILGVALLAVAASFLQAARHDVSRTDAEIARSAGDTPETCITSADGEEFCYTVSNRLEGMTIVGVGAVFMGMISTGLGQMNGFFLMRRCRVPSKVAVATSVFIVATSALAAATGHFIRFLQAGGDTLTTVLGIVTFTIPGVVIGGQLGAAVASRVAHHLLEKALGVLFAGIGILMLVQVIL